MTSTKPSTPPKKAKTTAGRDNSRYSTLPVVTTCLIGCLRTTHTRTQTLLWSDLNALLMARTSVYLRGCTIVKHGDSTIQLLVSIFVAAPFQVVGSAWLSECLRVDSLQPVGSNLLHTVSRENVDDKPFGSASNGAASRTGGGKDLGGGTKSFLSSVHSSVYRQQRRGMCRTIILV